MKVFLRIFGITAIILTIFPFIAVDFWFVRVFDFPHLQLTLLTLIALLTYFLKFDIRSRLDYTFVICLTACFIYQGVKIFPYTAFSSFEVRDATKTTSKSIDIYTANVLQKNESIELLIADTKKMNPDVALFTETDEKWAKALSEALDADYPYSKKIPLDNTYGMMMFSKLELYGAEVKYIIEDTIPSIHTKLILSSKDTLQLFAIHPAPPTPQHNPSSVDRDAEMMKIAQLSRNSDFPVIVLGDFNDVAWSETTSLFQKASGLLDLRKGRGFFSTYNANSWVVRWPLDHVFSSAEFRVKSVDLGTDVNSDHFPFYVNFSFEPNLANEQELPPPTEEQLKKAFDQIENEKEDEAEQKGRDPSN